MSSIAVTASATGAGVITLAAPVTATAFDYRDYGRELSLCCRYFENVYATAIPSIEYANIAGMQPKRAVPTLTVVFGGGTGVYVVQSIGAGGGGQVRQNTAPSSAVDSCFNLSAEL